MLVEKCSLIRFKFRADEEKKIQAEIFGLNGQTGDFVGRIYHVLTHKDNEDKELYYLYCVPQDMFERQEFDVETSFLEANQLNVDNDVIVYKAQGLFRYTSNGHVQLLLNDKLNDDEQIVIAMLEAGGILHG